MKNQEMHQFNGEFTEEYSRSFRERRQALGLNYVQAAKLLQVTVLTVRAWEHGLTQRCQASNINAVRLFLAGQLQPPPRAQQIGEYDFRFTRRRQGIPAAQQKLLQKVRIIHSICKNTESLRQKLFQHLNQTSQAALQSFIQRN